MPPKDKDTKKEKKETVEKKKKESKKEEAVAKKDKKPKQEKKPKKGEDEAAFDDAPSDAGAAAQGLERENISKGEKEEKESEEDIKEKLKDNDEQQPTREVKEEEDDRVDKGEGDASKVDKEGKGGEYGEKEDKKEEEEKLKEKGTKRTDTEKSPLKEDKQTEVEKDEPMPKDRNPYTMFSAAVAKKLANAARERAKMKAKFNGKSNVKRKGTKETKEPKEAKEIPKVKPKVENKEETDLVEKEKSGKKKEIEVQEPEPEEQETKKKKKKEIVCILDEAQLAELNTMPQLLRELSMMLDQHRDDVTRFSDIVDVVDSAVFDLEERHLGHTFQLMWHIDSFYKKFKDARDKVKPIVFSPSFDTHPYGYKMALSMCPYGDGKFRGRYMSIFYCLLKSEHDSLQTWPFSLPITISLVSQASDEDDRVDHSATFTPNPINENKVFLGRPFAARNPSLGFPKFIAIEELWEDEFVKDDQLFIKVEVNTSGITML